MRITSKIDNVYGCRCSLPGGGGGCYAAGHGGDWPGPAVLCHITAVKPLRGPVPHRRAAAEQLIMDGDHVLLAGILRPKAGHDTWPLLGIVEEPSTGTHANVPPIGDFTLIASLLRTASTRS